MTSTPGARYLEVAPFRGHLGFGVVSMSTNDKDRPMDKSPPAPAAPTRPVINVRDLLGGTREAILVHQGEHYRLRVTSSEKLILTK